MVSPSDTVPPPVQMVQLLAGFQLSQALYTAAKLGVADALVDGPRPVADVAAAVGADPAALRRLLRTLASVGAFTETEPGVVGLTPLGATLASDTPGSMRDLALMWMETHYAPFARLCDGVKAGRPAAELHYGEPFFAWLGERPEQVARFSGAMANLTNGIKAAAVAQLDVGGASTLVDVGGADGALLATILALHPDLNGVLFDLPHVVSGAGKVLAGAGVADRVEVVGGNFFEGVPTGDTYLLSFVLHDWSDAEAGAILRAVRAANPSAALLLLELVPPPGDQPHMAKMIDLTMLGMLTGHERDEQEWQALLAAAGFELEGVEPTPGPMSVIRAKAR
jgi:hypothetical protein